jgi:predicted transcriptional regulator
MSSQVLIEQASARTFAALLRAHAAATRSLSAQLSAEHGLTLSDYEVLLRLAHAEDRRMRRVDLAEQVLLSASGVTRLLDGLEQSGFVERASCSTSSARRPEAIWSRSTRSSERGWTITSWTSSPRSWRGWTKAATSPTARRPTSAHSPLKFCQ